jgi:methylated-DNA-[protein]-cysteine S-methyltransferase
MIKNQRGYLRLNYFYFPVSFGTILVSWNSQGLLNRIEWSENRLAVYHKVKIPTALGEVIDRIRGYFYQGEPIGMIPWDLIDQSDWTEFQKKVYQTIAKIPHGETRTYGWVARQMNQTSASRAVGQALKKNPIPILIPCHRVLSLTSIGGFMGVIDPTQPELKLKRRLMILEEEYQSPVFSFLSPAGTWNEYGQAGLS